MSQPSFIQRPQKALHQFDVRRSARGDQFKGAGRFIRLQVKLLQKGLQAHGCALPAIKDLRAGKQALDGCAKEWIVGTAQHHGCLLYTSDAADD